jgi:hypothetical protein
MENAGIFYGHLEHFTVIWYILWPFGNVVAIWYIFPRFGLLCREKSGNPGLRRVKKTIHFGNFTFHNSQIGSRPTSQALTSFPSHFFEHHSERERKKKKLLFS